MPDSPDPRHGPGEQAPTPPEASALGMFLARSEALPVGRLDGRGHVIWANPALARLIGRSDGIPEGEEVAPPLDEASTNRWDRWLAGRAPLAATASDVGGSVEMLDLGFRDAGGSSKYRCLIGADGSGGFWLLAVPAPTEVREGEARLLRRDRARATRALRRLARTDPLTGLPNRRQADRWLRQSVARARRLGRPLACLMVDLDRFKSSNDTLGHLEGDRLLKQAARALELEAGPGGLAARFGGDEFLILQPGMGRDEAMAFAERLRAALAEALAPSSASIGVACARADDTPEALLSRADTALGRAKGLGRDRVEFEG